MKKNDVLRFVTVDSDSTICVEDGFSARKLNDGRYELCVLTPLAQSNEDDLAEKLEFSSGVPSRLRLRGFKSNKLTVALCVRIVFHENGEVDTNQTLVELVYARCLKLLKVSSSSVADNLQNCSKAARKIISTACDAMSLHFEFLECVGVAKNHAPFREDNIFSLNENMMLLASACLGHVCLQHDIPVLFMNMVDSGGRAIKTIEDQPDSVNPVFSTTPGFNFYAQTPHYVRFSSPLTKKPDLINQLNIISSLRGLNPSFSHDSLCTFASVFNGDDAPIYVEEFFDSSGVKFLLHDVDSTHSCVDRDLLKFMRSYKPSKNKAKKACELFNAVRFDNPDNVDYMAFMFNEICNRVQLYEKFDGFIVSKFFTHIRSVPLLPFRLYDFFFDDGQHIKDRVLSSEPTLYGGKLRYTDKEFGLVSFGHSMSMVDKICYVLLFKAVYGQDAPILNEDQTRFDQDKATVPSLWFYDLIPTMDYQPIFEWAAPSAVFKLHRSESSDFRIYTEHTVMSWAKNKTCHRVKVSTNSSDFCVESFDRTPFIALNQALSLLMNQQNLSQFRELTYDKHLM